MKRSRLLLTVATVVMFSSSAVVSSDIYKWTDNDGNVHYEDRPTDKQLVLRLDINSRATDNAAIQAQTQARLEARAAADQVASEAPAEMSKQELRAEKERRQQQCLMYRDQLDRFLRSRQLYREGEDGERAYLDASQTQAARTRVEGQIREYCGT